MPFPPQVLAAVVIAVVAVATIGFVIVDDLEKNKTGKRLRAVTGGAGSQKPNAGSQNPEQSKDRRRQVAESLRKLEERQKELSKKKAVGLETMLEQAGWELTVREFYMISGIVGCVMMGIGLVSGQTPLVTVAMGVAGTLGLPRWVLGRARKKRQKKFVEEFSNAIDVIVRGVKSGLPVNECLRIIARDAASPVREEFHLLAEGIRLGLSLEQSLDRMYQRMPLSEVNFFSIVLIIQKQTGGNLADALNNLSTVLRSRKMMLGKIAALSMEAKASAAILAAMPVMVTTLVYLAEPEYLEPLYMTPQGKIALVGAAIWMMTGVIVMKNMINIKV